MVEIKLYDYEDEYGCYNYIGMGNLSAEIVTSQISAAKGKDLLIRINSGGGSVFAGWSIYNALISHDGAVTIVIEGLCASIASVIAMAGHTVKAFKASLIMIHQPSRFQLGDMNSDQLRKEADTLDIIQDVLVDIYQDKTEAEFSFLQEMINAETWMKASEAKDLGFIDEVLIRTPKELPKSANNLVLNKMPDQHRLFYNLNIMAKTKSKGKGVLDKINASLDSLGKLFKNVVEGFENASVKLADDSELFFEGELEEGTAVFSDEEMTVPATDGDHVLADGRTVTVAEGLVSAIAEAEDGDAQNALSDDERTELEELRAENQVLNAGLTKALGTMAKLEKVASNYKPEPREVKKKTDAAAPITAAEFKNTLAERKKAIAEKKAAKASGK